MSNREDLFRPLRYDWEVSSCLVEMYMTGLGHDDIPEHEEKWEMTHLWGTPYEGEVILPKLLHLCAIFLGSHAFVSKLTLLLLPQQLSAQH